VRISLSGALGETYDLWYRVHVATVGWLDWTKDGMDAGSTGRSLPIEALEVKLQKKGEAAPGPTTKPSLDKAVGSISGDAMLDSYVKSIIDTSTGTGPDALRKAYDYVVNHYKFKHYEPTPMFDDDWKEWTVKSARELVERGEGNCYRSASLMCWLARRLGYDARVVVGTVPTDHGPGAHAWVDVVKDGETYLIDATFHRSMTDRDFFMRTYDEAPASYTK
jgi:transglutaminase/protease-like cytokinesis protein 3